jgi:DNA-binding CsgD family transcriptional regulator
MTVIPERGLRREPGSSAQPLLEREAELAVLSALVEAARSGDGRLVAVEGDAGIGKTRLLAEARSFAGEFEVLSARAGELETDFAFGIVRQLFEGALVGTSADVRNELLSGAAALAAPLVALVPDEVQAGGGETSFAMLHGLYWLAANFALRRATMLLVDDLHWADESSLRWLSYLARRLEGLPLLVVVGTRPPQQGQHSALVTELLMDPAAVVLRPAMLSRGAVELLARGVFAAEPDAEFCEACRAASGGNPLFLRALLMTLAGSGVEPVARSAARVREVGPEPVARAVSLRLSRLPPEAEALARAIAVLGQSAELGHAAALAGIERPVAFEAAAALGRADLIRGDAVLEFTHPVVRAAIYETIEGVERIAAHHRAAAVLAEAGAEPEQSASHLLLVPPAGDQRTTAILRDAGRRAVTRGSAATAVTYMRRALAESPASEERGEMLWDLGRTERSVDLAASLEHLGEAVALIGDPVRHAELALDYGRAEMYANLDRPKTIETFREAIKRLGAGHSELRELLEAELLNGALGGGPELYPTVRELVTRVDDQTLSGGFGTDLILAGLAHYETRRGLDRARTLELAERAIATRLVERAAGHALYYPPHALGAAGNVSAAMGYYARAIDHARRTGDLLSLGGLLGFRGSLATEQGDLLSAEQDLREGLELTKQVGVAGNVMYLAAWLTEFLLERGALEEAEATIAALGLPEQVPVSLHFIFFLAARGRLRLEQRDPAKALADFEAIGRIGEAVEIRNPAFRPWRSGAAAALHALEHADEARELAGEELELARRWGASRSIGIALRARGLVDQGAVQERWLRESIDVLASSAARLEYAKALIELGCVLRRRAERANARELLRQGVELAHVCGAIALVERGNEELAATGARPRNLLLTGLDSLTASERRVAQLAAEDLSNKDIAQALFVTVKTVEVHLSRVYRKLDIESRRHLAAALSAPAAKAAAPS